MVGWHIQQYQSIAGIWIYFDGGMGRTCLVIFAQPAPNRRMMLCIRGIVAGPNRSNSRPTIGQTPRPKTKSAGGKSQYDRRSGFGVSCGTP